MSAHDKKCEVILWKNNLWSACWCHERALEAEVERLTQSLLIERGSWRRRMRRTSVCARHYPCSPSTWKCALSILEECVLVELMKHAPP